MTHPTPRPVQCGALSIGPGQPLCLIAGPCALETEEHALHLAGRLREMCQSAGLQLLFKASFDKANRSHHGSYRGPGLKRGLEMLRAVKSQIGVPVTTDIHLPEQAPEAAEVCDLLQIPALLCRQTDLLQAAARTGRPINVKKGQFAAPKEMKAVAAKILAEGNREILLTERGTSFGYHYLVNDFRALTIMRKFASAVCYDVSHSLQLPGAEGTHSGGQPEFLFAMARAGIAAGCDALFVEVHDHPPDAKSDGATACSISQLPAQLHLWRSLHELVANFAERAP